MKIQLVMLLAGMAILRAEIYSGTSSAESYTGTESRDWVMMGAGDDTVSAAGGDDFIWGDDGADVLYGGAGNDAIFAGSILSPGDTAGNVFFGGEGNDFLSGGAYGDTYHYNLGDGFDTIRESGTLANEIDKVVFGPGISSGSLTYGREKGDLFVELSSGDILRIQSWFGSSTGEFKIEEFQFDSDPTLQGSTLPFDGTTWNGTTGNDTYTASGSGNFWLLGGAGNDTLTAAGGMDVLVGGAGADSLYGRDGDDGIYGEADNDTLNGENGNDTLDGGTGNDTLSGGNGDDQLVGGKGNDTLYGALGNDIYSWAVGDGDDVIQDDSGYDGATAVNHLTFAPGILPSDVGMEVVAANANHIKFVIKQGGVANGSVTINYWSKTHDYTSVKHNSTWRIEFSDGTVWNGAVLGTPLADTLTGNSSADTLSGSAGNDILYGFDGNDILNGDADNDTLYGGNGNDSLAGGAGNDTLYGEAGNDSLDGGIGNDNLTAGDGDDQLIGSAGDDTLYGGAGNDSYIWSVGDGIDVIQDDLGYNGATAVNHLVFGTGIAPSDVTTETVPSNAAHLKFTIKQSGIVIGSVTINYWANVQDYTSVKHASTWRIDFSNGTTWTGATLATALSDVLTGTSGNDTINGGGGNDSITGNDGDDSLSGDDGVDTLYGNAGNDSLSGGTGNDVIYGGTGTDTIIGGAGDDTLNGETGNDSYRWELGDGNDVINDSTSEFGSTVENQLVFGAGISPSNVELVLVGSYSLKFMVKDDGGAVVGSATVNNWYLTVSGNIQHRQAWKIAFANGTVWDGKTMATPGAEITTGGSGNDSFSGGGGNDTLTGNDGDDALSGDDGADTLYGNAGNDSLSGGTGNDVIYGGTGNDHLWGGAGNDVLNGEYGSDVYHWSQGDGDDTITESFWETSVDNTLALEGGISPGRIDFTREGSTRLKVSVMGIDSSSASIISIDNWAALSGSNRFFSLWKLDLGAFGSFRFGNLPTTGIDAATGTSSDDLLIGLDGDDTLTGGDGNDYLAGGTGNDILNGGTGADLIAGGAGNDILSGGDGDDTYFVNLGGGHDTITEPLTQLAGENNQLSFGSGIDPNNIVVTWSSGDLVIQYETNGSVRVSNWFSDSNRARAIECVKFANGVTWDREFTENRIYTVGSGGGSGSPNVPGLIPAEDVNSSIESYTPPIAVTLEVLTPLN